MVLWLTTLTVPLVVGAIAYAMFTFINELDDYDGE